MKTTFFLSVIFLIIFTVISCSEDSVSNSAHIEYLSFESLGCHSEETLLKENNKASIEWKYRDDNLTISTLFTTHCSALMTDSVVATDDRIEIFLRDTCTTVAKCICPHKEVFLFNTETSNTIEVEFYYKAITSDEYYELAKSTIDI